MRPIYRRMSRWSAAFALIADFAFLTLGGGLKRREMISARLGDILSELYFLSATLKRWENEGRQEADLPLVQFTAETAFDRISESLDLVLANLPARWAGWLLRAVTLPKSASRGPSDALTEACADLISDRTATRDRLSGTLFHGCTGEGIAKLEAAFDAVIDCAPVERRLREAGLSPEQALKAARSPRPRTTA